MSASLVLDTLISGLSRGAIYALVALGYTMVYGILGMINFAHGEICMIGMFSCVYGIAMMTALGSTNILLNLALGVIFSILLASAFGYANERIAYRRLRKAHPLAPLTSAIGLSMILQQFIWLNVSRTTVPFPTNYSDALSQQFKIGGSHISLQQIVTLAIAFGLMGVLFFVIQKTRLGVAMRATSQDQLMASLVGIPVNRVIAATFIIGSALAAVAGIMQATYVGYMTFDDGSRMGMKAFIAAVLGGIGNIPGAVIGGLLVGLVEDFAIASDHSQWRDGLVFLILIVVLLVRPRGLLGERVADKV